MVPRHFAEYHLLNTRYQLINSIRMDQAYLASVNLTNLTYFVARIHSRTIVKFFCCGNVPYIVPLYQSSMRRRKQIAGVVVQQWSRAMLARDDATIWFGLAHSCSCWCWCLAGLSFLKPSVLMYKSSSKLCCGINRLNKIYWGTTFGDDPLLLRSVIPGALSLSTVGQFTAQVNWLLA